MLGKWFKGALSAVGMLFLILDARTALAGASDGIMLCLKTVIPSLLPFFVLSNMLTASLAGKELRLLRPVEKLCGIPKGSGCLLLIGILGGYPVGARCVYDAYSSGHLEKKNAQRMLGFCSNAGPSFLFGMVAMKFQQGRIGWALWGIHIFAALTVGALLPGKTVASRHLSNQNEITLEAALKRAVRVMADVCGWIVMFRIILAFLDCWFLWILPDAAKVAAYGILELANGCCELEMIGNTGLRFVIAAAILGFGGCSVLLQTVSVTGEIGLGQYIPGRILHGCISIVLALIVQSFFPTEQKISPLPWVLLPLLTGLFLIFVQKSKNKSRKMALSGI